MLKIKTSEERIADTLVSQAKISLHTRFVPPKDGQEGKQVLNPSTNNPYYVMSRYYEYIRLFNSITEFQTRVLSHEISEIYILKEFSDFVIPRTVRFEPSNFWSKDLLSRESRDETGLSYEEFMKLQNHIRRFVKKDAVSDLVCLDSLKVHKSLSDVWPYVVDKGKNVAYESKAFVPLEIDYKGLSWLYDEVYFNTPADKVLNQFISEMKF